MADKQKRSLTVADFNKPTEGAPGIVRRTFEVRSADPETRTVELSFSSEIEYRRWWGMEVLGHEPHEVELGRMSSGAALLVNHDWDDQVGVVESVRIDADRVGRATVRFGRSARAQEIFQDVQDGIRKLVSVGYRVHEAKLVETRDEGETEVYRVTKWEPFEISLVAVPADASVGVGRTLEIPQEEPEPKPAETATVTNLETRTEQPAGTIKPMKTKFIRNASGALVEIAVNEDGSNGAEIRVVQTAEEARALSQNGVVVGQTDERGRAADIIALGQRFGAATEAVEAVRSGASVSDFQAVILARQEQRQTRPLNDQAREADVGMTDAEVARFSFLRAARALAPGAGKKEQDAAAFEFECSRAAAQRAGKEAKGIMVPTDVLSRAFNAGGAANSPAGAQTGELLVPHQSMTGSFIDMLRNQTTIMRLATVMAGMVGTFDIPKQTGGASGYWVGEGDDATEGTPSLGQIAFAPKTVAAYTDLTRRLMMQSSPSAEAMVRSDLQTALAQAIDIAGYYGTGSDNQPRGLKNYTGINAVDFAADGSAGAKPTFSELVQMETEVAADNAAIGQMGYVGHTRFRGHAKTTAKFGTGTESTIWEPGNTVNGYRTEITNQVLASDVFFGNFRDVIIALWGGLDLIVDASSLSKSGGLRLVAFQDADINLRRVESVCWGSHLVV